MQALRFFSFRGRHLRPRARRGLVAFAAAISPDGASVALDLPKIARRVAENVFLGFARAASWRGAARVGANASRCSAASARHSSSHASASAASDASGAAAVGRHATTARDAKSSEHRKPSAQPATSQVSASSTAIQPQ